METRRKMKGAEEKRSRGGEEWREDLERRKRKKHNTRREEKRVRGNLREKLKSEE